ncbi:MAG: hypothetical protein ACHQ1G_04490 [Planctomycetota bacterium]
MAATWPDTPVPAPKGPTGRKHLKRISKAALDGHAPNLTDIEGAIEACLKGYCLQAGNPPQRGKPPPDLAHGTSVLVARWYATDSPDWDECLAALRHGEAIAEQARKPRPA